MLTARWLLKPLSYSFEKRNYSNFIMGHLSFLHSRTIQRLNKNENNNNKKILMKFWKQMLASIISFICGSCTIFPEKGNKNSPPNFRFSMIRNIIPFLYARNERTKKKNWSVGDCFVIVISPDVSSSIVFILRRKKKPVNAFLFLFFTHITLRWHIFTSNFERVSVLFIWTDRFSFHRAWNWDSFVN